MFDLTKYIDNFLPHCISDKFSSLDGSDVAVWLKSIGEKVAFNYDTGRCGLAVTYSRLRVSTNGFVSVLRPYKETANHD